MMIDEFLFIAFRGIGAGALFGLIAMIDIQVPPEIARPYAWPSWPAPEPFAPNLVSSAPSDENSTMRSPNARCV